MRCVQNSASSAIPQRTLRLKIFHRRARRNVDIATKFLIFFFQHQKSFPENHWRKQAYGKCEKTTDSRDRLDDPVYVGWRHVRVRGDEYDNFVKIFINAVVERWLQRLPSATAAGTIPTKEESAGDPRFPLPLVFWRITQPTAASRRGRTRRPPLHELRFYTLQAPCESDSCGCHTLAMYLLSQARDGQGLYCGRKHFHGLVM